MKKKFNILLLFILTSVAASAQSVSKQINDIKRSSQYVSAEATMETEAQAYELAEELLSKQISEFASSQKSLKDAPNVIVKDVAGKAEKLQMNRGTMTRVFLYVKKDDIMAADNTRVLVQPQKSETSDDGEKPAREEKEKKKQKKSKSGQTGDVPVATVVPVSPETPVAGSEEGGGTRLTASWQQTVIDDLLACPTVTAARGMLTRLRAERKIKRFGSADNCPDASTCFWLIFDEDGRVVTILGDGQAERTNFRTMDKDLLSNYKGRGAIWFTLSK